MSLSSCMCVCVCIYQVAHNRAIRPCHPSQSMSLALILTVCLCLLHIINRSGHNQIMLNNVSSCQTGGTRWSNGQETIRGSSTKLQREHAKLKQAKTTKRKELRKFIIKIKRMYDLEIA